MDLRYKVAQAAPGSGSSYRSKPYKNSRPSLENISENGISNILSNDEKEIIKQLDINELKSEHDTTVL